MGKRKWAAVSFICLLAMLCYAGQTAAMAKVLTGTEILAASAARMDSLEGYQIGLKAIAQWQTEDHSSAITLIGKYQVTAAPFGFAGQQRLALRRTFFEDEAEMVQSYWISQRTEETAQGLVVHQMTDFDGDNRWEEEILPAEGQSTQQWRQYQAYVRDVLVRQESVLCDEKDCYQLRLTLSSEALSDFAGYLTSMGIDAKALQEAALLSEEPVYMDLWIAKKDYTLIKQQAVIEAPFTQTLIASGIAAESAAFSMTLTYHVS